MTITVIIASFGDLHWERLGRMRALASTVDQGFDEVIVKHEEEMTLAEVRNAAAHEATGDYLLFLDADDVIAPGYLAAMRAALAEQPAGEYLLTPAIQYGAGKVFSPPRFWPECEIETGNWMVVGTLVPRRVFLFVQGWDEYELYEDWALWAKCVLEGLTIVKVPDAHYMVYVTANSRNRGKPRKTYLYWRQRIGADIWPDLYLPPTEEEDAARQLETPLRFVETRGTPCA